jgi:pyruvate dehydrogenase E1 component alpha subunit
MPIKNVGTYTIEYLQVLDEKGKLDAKLEPKLSDEHLLTLYRGMCLARAADERQLKLQRQGRMGTFGPCTGQEAAVCAPALAMRRDDWFVGAFREIGGRLMRGVALDEEYLFWNGWEEGNVTPDAHRTLPNAVIVASQTLHAVGLAYASKYRGEDSVTVCFMGDGATSQGDFYEAMNFASVWKVPCVFICMNNQWAISVPRSMQTAAPTLAQKAVAAEMPGLQVDGNDALAMYRATSEAIERARKGEGPTFIEAVTFRLLMHTTADDPTKYRQKAVEEEWWKKDPLPRFRGYLETKGLLDAKKQVALDAEIKAEVDAAVKRFESRTDFKIDAPFDHVFGTEHEMIEEQRQEFLALLAEETGRSLDEGATEETAHA